MAAMRERPNASGCVVYPTRPIGVYPNQWVRAIDDTIEIAFADETTRQTGDGWRVSLSRADARLLAKRLNQCLDETRKR